MNQARHPALRYCLVALLLSAPAAYAQLQNVTLSPLAGSAPSDTIQTFTAIFSDSNGAADINETDLLFNSGPSGYHGCYVGWTQWSNGFYLADDSGANWQGPLTAGSGSLQNSQCTLYGSGSYISVAGTSVSMVVSVSFKSVFAGPQGTYVQSFATSGWIAPLQPMGTWTVVGAGVPDLTISKSHAGNFFRGQAGTYSLTVSNIGIAPTNGTVTVLDTLPGGMTAAAMTGTGWSCSVSTLACTRADPLPGGSSYPVITLTVNVSSNADASLWNIATVSGGGEVNNLNDTAQPCGYRCRKRQRHASGDFQPPTRWNIEQSGCDLDVECRARSFVLHSVRGCVPGFLFVPRGRHGVGNELSGNRSADKRHAPVCPPMDQFWGQLVLQRLHLHRGRVVREP